MSDVRKTYGSNMGLEFAHGERRGIALSFRNGFECIDVLGIIRGEYSNNAVLTCARIATGFNINGGTSSSKELTTTHSTIPASEIRIGEEIYSSTRAIQSTIANVDLKELNSHLGMMFGVDEDGVNVAEPTKSDRGSDAERDVNDED
ncbi:hypothetical protein L210DRAFT_3500983 [Boletus edulis BED1]|uniref:Uncharacterized protein n=1 Tax=Boletus edulis BED1 TaxID=1328754 RepID=A0AAD4GIF6_BOLED|nr:hypothetical protein L210DRAFT_3500983 [Boletus edulis BED1]